MELGLKHEAQHATRRCEFDALFDWRLHRFREVGNDTRSRISMIEAMPLLFVEGSFSTPPASPSA
jgi:hypothetical protein